MTNKGILVSTFSIIKIILFVPLTFALVSCLIRPAEATSVLADVKTWNQNTNFSNQLNWRGNQLPCVDSVERKIVIEEDEALIVMPNAIRALTQSTILPSNGLLLFEDIAGEDGTIEQDSESRIKTIKEKILVNNAGGFVENCEDGAPRPYSASDPNQPNDFIFQIANDRKSWYNPKNWLSSFYSDRQYDPHSHQIPCSHDTVILGDDHSGFKINFASNLTKSSTHKNVHLVLNVHRIQISNLHINGLEYDNELFSLLLQSSEYDNLLFSANINNHDEGDSYGNFYYDEDLNKGYKESIIMTIDNSSLTSEGYCIDDIGCSCGNEEMAIMEKICSFVMKPDDDTLTCDDPIYSSGYCYNICATVMDVILKPAEFQAKYFEGFIASELYDSEDETNTIRKYASKVHVISRRVHENKYEVTFFDKGDTQRGLAHELATSIQSRLLRDLRTNNLYGIRSVSLRSSSQWRLAGSDQMWNVLLIAVILIVSLYFAYDRSMKYIRYRPKDERASFVRFHNDANDQVQMFHRHEGRQTLTVLKTN